MRANQQISQNCHEHLKKVAVAAEIMISLATILNHVSKETKEKYWDVFRVHPKVYLSRTGE